MTRKQVLGVVCLVSLLFTVCVSAQEAPPAGEPTASLGPPATPATASVLRLIRFSGALSDPSAALGTGSLGQARTGVVGVTFALYAEQEGGAPLWLETQNVTLDPQGHYTVLLGATASEGLPLEIFSSSEARWLGIQVQGEAEQPRILLVAVPYALKAAEAETLSGKKASDFILNEQLSEQVQKEIETQVEEKGLVSADDSGTTPQAVNETGRSTFTDSNGTEVVFVRQSGSGFGLRATAPSNSGLRGEATDLTGKAAGVEGVAAGQSGRGVYGHTTYLTGPNIGVLGETPSTKGRGVHGVATSATGPTVGVRGDTFSPDGTGVTGFARHATGGTAVYGLAVGSSAIAGRFENAGAGQLISGVTSSHIEIFSVGGDGSLTLRGGPGGSGGFAVQQNSTSPNVIAGSKTNTVGDGVVGATISGGGLEQSQESPNRVTGNFGTVGGGWANRVGYLATVAGGFFNRALGIQSTVGGGGINYARGHSATVAGGEQNTAGCDGTEEEGVCAPYPATSRSTVGGGFLNNALGFGATVGGGENNNAPGYYTTVSGGRNNRAAGWATVGGGELNNANGGYATIGGGDENRVTDNYGTVGGGTNNAVGSNDSDATNATAATVGGGEINQAAAGWATVGGGLRNTVLEKYATVGGGTFNTASGRYSSVPGGFDNTAQGVYSFAAGQKAKANHDGAFVWADDNAFDFASTAANEFSARAVGGVRFVSAIDGTGTPTAGVTLAPGGGSWSSLSDRHLKENIVPVDGAELLARLDEIPIATWNYKAQDASIRHLGPMAQDFYAAFGLGVDDKHITTIDGQGVALAALQALYRASLEQEKRLRALEAENEQLKQELAEQVGSLEAELAALKAAFEGQNGIKLAAATNAGVASGAK